MKVTQTPIEGLVLVESQALTDHRGSFARLYCREELRDIIGARRIAQINHSRTEKVGAVRGMHYQHAPHAEMKMVRCIAGRVWDVAVDLRRGSKTFLNWYATELSPDSRLMLVLPEGCAHGFQVLEANSELLYLHTESYEPSSEGGVRPTDPVLGISWPLAVRDLSERDGNLPLLSANFEGLDL